MSKIAPTGWGEVKFDFNRFERLSSINIVLKIYFLFMATLPFIISILFVLKMSSDEAQEGRSPFSLLFINAFLFMSSLTIICALSMALMFIARAAGILDFPIIYSAGLNKLAIGVGTGAAIGTFAATLTPVVSGLFSSFGGNPSDMAATALDPSNLIELPAVAAVFGYFYGVISAVFGLLGNCRNLVYKRLIPLIVLCVSVYTSSLCSLTPKGIVAWNLSRIQSSAGESLESCSVSASGSEMLEKLNDPVLLLLKLESCGESVVLANNYFYVLIILGFIVYAVASFLKDCGSKSTE